MKRLPLNLACGASLLLSVAISSAWIRSHWRHDYVHDRRCFFEADREGYVQRVLHSGLGRVRFERGGEELYYDDAIARFLRSRVTLLDKQSRPWTWDWAAVPAEDRWRAGLTGFLYKTNFQGTRRTGRIYFYRAVELPYWAVWLAATALPAVRVGAFIRKERTRAAAEHGRVPCTSCGYDLRATPERCPECGTAAARTLRTGDGTK